MNILIKLTCLIGLVLAPILGGHTVDAEETREEATEVSVNISEAEENQDEKIALFTSEKNR
jgi:K(+)-stimulated pyrophosphate-energized sodium pump